MKRLVGTTLHSDKDMDAYYVCVTETASDP